MASLDLGSNSIKLLVGEMQKGKLIVLACVDVVSQGIKQGFIINQESATLALKDAFKKAETMIGLPIRKVIVSVPSYNADCFLSSGSVTIKSDDKVINSNDVIRSMQLSIFKKVDENKDVISIMPTKFIIDDADTVKNPINMIGNKLTIQDVVTTIPKKNSETILKCLENIGIQVVDICISPIADFFAFQKPDYNRSCGAVVNIGHSNTIVSIFNKGILVSCEVLDIGTNNVDNDIAYIFKINKKDANYLKERFVNLDIHSADPSDSITMNDVNNNEVKINQYDISAVVISRLHEIFNLIKKQINLLTKKEISYIIFSGGVSELKNFESLMTEEFGNKAILGNVTELGARNNKYSVVCGMIKYYDTRLRLRNANFSLFTEDELEELGGKQKRINISDNSLLGKIFGLFFDN